MDPALIHAYEDAWTKWLTANRDHPGLYHGPAPKHEDYGFTTDLDKWHANEIERRVRREMERTI